MEICPYCGTRSPLAENAPAGQPPRCHECGGVLDDLSMMATQIAMGPWFFRMPGKPYGPGCDITVLRRLLAAGRIKPDSAIRGPGSNQLWKKVKSIPGVAHLAGQCHSCGEKVKPESKFCGECGTKFETPGERNTWGLPSRPVADVIAEFRKTDATTCCVCGHGKTTADECPECETIFSPADEATKVTLGGWFVHGKQHAYKPGMSYEQLKKEIDAGNVTGRTIVKGPTTEQFWKLAKSTQGVAHLLGTCHACAAKVDATSGACHVCGASFSVPSDPDWVGLRYPTAEAAAAAQKQLDAELAKIAATMPAAPAPKKRQAKAARPVTEEAEATESADVVEEYVEAEGESDEYAGMPPGYEEDQSYSEEGYAEHAYAETESDDQGGFDIHQDEHHEQHDEHAFAAAAAPAHAAAPAFDVAAAPASISDAKERRITSQYNKSKTTLIAWAVITPLILIGAVVAINMIPKKEPTKDAAKDTASNKDGNEQKAQASDQLTKLKKDTETRFAQFKNVDRKGKAGPLMQEAEATLAKANQLMDSEQFLEADAEFRKVEAPLAKVELMQQHRAQATEMRGRAQEAQNEAKRLVAAQHAKAQWDEAEASFALGAKLLSEETYDQAIVAWNNATEQYGKAARLVQVMLTAADVRAKIEAEATKSFTRDELEREDVAAWKAFKAKIKAGDDAVAEKKYEEGMQYFDQARQMVESVNDAMKRQIGRNYWAYQTGRLTARILTPKVAGYHPDEEMLAQLKMAYVNLEINRDFFNRIPLSKNCSYKELADVLVIECAKEIETTFEGNGEAIKNSFGLGMHLYIVEKQLRADVGKLTTRTREEIDLYVKKVIPDAARAAGYAPEFLAAVKDFEETLATEVNIPTKSREKWAAITEKLENFDTAIKIVGARK